MTEEGRSPQKPSRWSTEWWWDVDALLKRAHTFYKKAEGLGKPSIIAKASSVIIELRNWQSVATRIRKTLPAALDALQCFYAPKDWGPGPSIVFPEFDVDGVARQAQIKPMSGRFGDAKYFRLGDKDAFMGPIWVGNDRATREAVISSGSVLLVEGPFDLLAVRCVCPRMPSMTPLTKKLGWKHLAWLQMYGVEKVYLMFDNELSEVGGTAMIETTKKLQRRGIAVEMLQCPAKDASKALESVQKFERLKAVLEGAASQVMPSAVIIDNDVIEEY
jgi:hypothetical protein